MALKTAPRGFPRDHPRVTLLCHKLLIAGRRLAPRARSGLPRDTALDFTRDTWAACMPMTAWLDRHIGISELPSPTRR